MSLNSLATSRVAYDQPQSKGPAIFAASDDAVGPKGQDVQNALSALVEYIPGETVTLYLATVSSLPVLGRRYSRREWRSHLCALRSPNACSVRANIRWKAAGCGAPSLARMETLAMVANDRGDHRVYRLGPRRP